jgi:predicted secreted hydrolase
MPEGRKAAKNVPGIFLGMLTFLLGGNLAAFCAEEKPAPRVVLPGDDGPHHELLEWWYWTGDLKTADGRRFGFHLVFFELRPLGVVFQITHHAIADVQRGRYFFRIERGRKRDFSRKSSIDLRHDDLRAGGENGRDRLYGSVGEYVLDLELVSKKAEVLQHRGGYIEYDFGGYSYYYSRARMEARGTITINGKEFSVSGSCWFDHQWGEMGEVFSQSWDWFGIQLDDGREAMVFRMRFKGEEKMYGGSICQAAGRCETLGPEQVAIFPEGQWKSPHSGCVYPEKWMVKIKDLQLEILPVLLDQEIWSHFPRYWEGLADVGGSARGRAFVELTNYCH